MTKRPKRPRDPLQLAKLIGDIATGQAVEKDPDAGKNAAAVALGQKGGAARSANLSKAKRAAIAKKAARARWSKQD